MQMQTMRRNDRHDPRKVAIMVRVEHDFRDRLEREVAASGLPNWTLSDHIRYDLYDRRGLWDKPYRPMSDRPKGRKK